MRAGAVDFDVPAEVAYDYLVEPANRSQWQSSLRTVEVDGAVRSGQDAEVSVGMTWTDVTWPGLRPRMQLTRAERPRLWTEVGHWHGVEADLTLVFEPTASGCRVLVEFEVRTPGVLSRIGPAVTAFAVRPVLGDLRRAARILRSR